MERYAWVPDELARAGAEHFDPEHVHIYDQKSATDPAHDIALLRQLGLNDSCLLVDLGAGTGTFALAIAPFCRRVVAVDVSRTMLSHLQEKTREHGLENVDVVEAGFLSYHHQSDPPDFIYTRNALHHLPDFWKAIALRRMHEMLASGGVLLMHDLVYSFEPDQAERVFETWLAGKPERPEEGYTRRDLETHIRDEFSTFSWLLEPMLERVGFEIRDVQHRASQTYSTYICVKR